MTKITIQLSRNIGFYYSMPVYLSVYKRVDTYDLDTLSDNVVNKLAVGERTEKHTGGNATPTPTEVEDVPVEPTVVETTKTEEVKEETPVVEQEAEVKAPAKRTRTTTAKKAAE